MKKLEKLFLLSPFLLTSCMNTSVKVSEIREISLDEFNIEETKLNNAKKSMVYLEENKINGLHYCGVTISEDPFCYYIASYGSYKSDDTILKMTKGYDNDGNSFNVSYIGTDFKNNIAVYKALKLGVELTVATGSSDYSQTMDVMSISTPFVETYTNVENSINIVRNGIISTARTGYFSTTMALASVERGAGVFDTNGALIGMIDSVINNDGGNGDEIDNYVVSLNRALKYDLLKDITKDIIDNNGDITRGLMGVTVTNYEIAQASSIGLPDEETICVAVSNVSTGSPAQKAGIEIGYLIYKIDGNVLNRIEDLSYYLARKNKGDSVTCEFIDFNSKHHTKTITLR